MQFKEIINLPVYTQSGYGLGRIIKVETDQQTDRPVRYIVRSHNFIRNLFRGCLIIEERQVISISRKKMIVKDTLKRIKDLAVSPAR